MTPETPWISCAERMPTEADADKNQRVLIRWPDGSMNDALYTRTHSAPPGTSWMRTPAPPKPVVKTQAEKDFEAWSKWYSAKGEPAGQCTLEVWHAACAYKSKEIGERLGEIIMVNKIHDYEAGFTKVGLDVFPKLNELARELTEAK